MSERLLFWDVDTQVDFMRADGKLYVPDAESLLENLGRLTEASRRHGIPVIASACDHELDDAEISAEPDYARTYPPHCLRGTPGAERVPETQREWTLQAHEEPLSEDELTAGLDADAPAVLIHKQHFDVFSNPNTEVILARLAPERIVIYGVALDVCNKAAIEGLLRRGWSGLTLVTDATRPIHAEAARELTDGWNRRGVRLTTTDELLASIESGGPPRQELDAEWQT